MGRILADLLSIFIVWRIDEETPFIRVYQSNPCHPCAIFKGGVVTFQECKNFLKNYHYSGG